MIYLQNSDLQNLIKAVAELNTQLVNVCQKLEGDNWIPIAEAERLTGLTQRQCRYRAETGKWKSSRRGKEFLFYAPDVLREHELSAHA